MRIIISPAKKMNVIVQISFLHIAVHAPDSCEQKGTG